MNTANAHERDLNQPNNNKDFKSTNAGIARQNQPNSTNAPNVQKNDKKDIVKGPSKSKNNKGKK